MDISPEHIGALREQGFSYAEIGEQLGSSKDAVRGRHVRWLAGRERPESAADGLAEGLVGEASGPDAGRPAGDAGALRETNRRLLRQLEQQKVKTEELVDAVYRAAYDAHSTLTLAATDAPAPQKTGGEEVAVVVLSDWQLAKVTPSYSSEVCEQRIHSLADKVIRLADIQRSDHPVRELRVLALGDIVEGEMIFPGQAHLIDASLYRQAIVDAPRILGDFLRRMLGAFESVAITGVIGNHGRIGRRGDFDPETNADRMAYRVTQMVLDREQRLTWNIPDGPKERNWYAVERIGAYSTLLLHGDQFRGHSGMPWYGIQKKAGGWALGAIEDRFDDIDFGHFHQPTKVTLNRITARCNGSTESHNTYAQEQMAAVGQPSQGLRFVHPKKGMVTAEYTVWL